MVHSVRRFTLASLLLLAVVGIGRDSPSAAAQQTLPIDQLQRIAIQRVAERTGIPAAELRIVALHRAEYRFSTQLSFDFKVLYDATRTPFSVVLSEQGIELSRASLVAEDEQARRAKVGALDEQLAERIATASPGDRFDVIIRVADANYEGPARPAPHSSPSAAELATFYELVRQTRSAHVAQVLTPVIAALAGRGVVVTPDLHTPTLYGSLTAEQLRQISTMPELRFVDLAPTASPTLSIARPTVGADGVHGRGIDGTDQKIAQVEVGGRVETLNPYLSRVVQDPTYVCGTASSHSTAVAGVMVSTETTIRGIAPDATLWAGGSCIGFGTELLNRAGAAVTWGARAINLSYGDTLCCVDTDVNNLDSYHDDLVINNYVTIVPAAGNRAPPCGSDAIVVSPGKGYNTLTAGGFNDFGTVEWYDAMYDCSSYVDPSSTHSDREKPDITGPAVAITSTSTTSPWNNYTADGTSYAAPMLTGTAALLFNRSPTLGSWPEAVRAILMASAVHNIEADERLSERDGAGSAVVQRADDIALQRAGNWTGVSYSCATGTIDLMTMALEAGLRTRVVIAWDNDPDYIGYLSHPSADLDLNVYDPSGNLAATSSSADNTYEIVDFAAGASGTFTARVLKYTCEYSPRFLAGAWLQAQGYGPTVASWTTGTRLDVFVRGRDDAVHQKIYEGSWSAWTSLGMPVTGGANSDPTAVWWQDNRRVDVFVRGSDNQLYQRSYCRLVFGTICGAAGWSAWGNLGGILTSKPATAAWTTGDRIDVFARGGGNDLYHRFWTSAGGWTAWADLGTPTVGGITSAPAAIWWQGNTRLDVFMRGTDKQLWQRFYCAAIGPWCGSVGWSGWYTLGGFLTEAPTAAAWTSGDRLEVFARDSANLLLHREWTSAGCGTWTNYLGPIESAPTAVFSQSNTQLDVFAHRPANTLERKTRVGSWTDWQVPQVYP